MEPQQLSEDSLERLRTASFDKDSIKENPLLIRKSIGGRKMSVPEHSEVDRTMVYETLKGYKLQNMIENFF